MFKDMFTTASLSVPLLLFWTNIKGCMAAPFWLHFSKGMGKFELKQNWHPQLTAKTVVTADCICKTSRQWETTAHMSKIQQQSQDIMLHIYLCWLMHIMSQCLNNSWLMATYV